MGTHHAWLVSDWLRAGTKPRMHLLHSWTLTVWQQSDSCPGSNSLPVYKNRQSQQLCNISLLTMDVIKLLPYCKQSTQRAHRIKTAVWEEKKSVVRLKLCLLIKIHNKTNTHQQHMNPYFSTKTYSLLQIKVDALPSCVSINDTLQMSKTFHLAL